jgi:hypothetical protein
MGKNMSTDRLAAISTGKERTSTGVTLNLIRLESRVKNEHSIPNRDMGKDETYHKDANIELCKVIK